MNLISRTITGGLIILFGIWFFFFLGFIDGLKIDFVAIIIGVCILIIGFFIFFNKKEDKIEQIKNKNEKKVKGGRK